MFKTTRKTPIDAWSAAHGAHWEPVGDWRRPYAYTRPGEAVKDAVTREVLNTRQGVGLLDASTLGKILVKGPDAGKFLDLIYTNVMSSLAVGRCRYGLMCKWLSLRRRRGDPADRGQFPLPHHLWRLGPGARLVAVVGPKARAVLESLGGMDVSREALPFMA